MEVSTLTDFGKLVKSLGMGQGNILAPHIDMWLEDNPGFAPTITIGGEKPDDGHFHPSYHCLMTEEQLFEDRHRLIHQSPTAQMKKTFDAGHFWHCYLQEALIAMGFVSPENVELKFLSLLPGGPKDGPYISGTVDLLDVNIPGRGSWLVDIKSTAAATFNTIERSSLYEKYVAQVNVYADRVDRENVMILVVSKDNGLMREIQIQRDQQLLDEIYRRWANVANSLSTVLS